MVNGAVAQVKALENVIRSMPKEFEMGQLMKHLNESFPQYQWGNYQVISLAKRWKFIITKKKYVGRWCAPKTIMVRVI